VCVFSPDPIIFLILSVLCIKFGLHILHRNIENTDDWTAFREEGRPCNNPSLPVEMVDDERRCFW
jgi:hypothetical protein